MPLSREECGRLDRGHSGVLARVRNGRRGKKPGHKPPRNLTDAATAEGSPDKYRGEDAPISASETLALLVHGATIFSRSSVSPNRTGVVVIHSPSA
jgi:hypothetical protein